MQTNVTAPRFGDADPYSQQLQARQAQLQRNEAMVEFAAQQKRSEDVVAFASAKSHQATRLDVRA